MQNNKTNRQKRQKKMSRCQCSSYSFLKMARSDTATVIPCWKCPDLMHVTTDCFVFFCLFCLLVLLFCIFSPGFLVNNSFFCLFCLFCLFFEKVLRPFIFVLFLPFLPIGFAVLHCFAFFSYRLQVFLPFLHLLQKFSWPFFPDRDWWQGCLLLAAGCWLPSGCCLLR